MTTSQSQPATNSRWIWPFEILEQIGEGGMGVVYRARYVVNGRQVALKMVPSEIADKTALARFERELEVLKTLRHPNIVRCFGGVCEDKRRFYAMELLEGGSLEDQLQAKKRFPWDQVVQYGLQMCAALACSHEKGVIHRDVKPSNFLLTPSGQVKLSDFGLASVSTAHKITASGKTAGTFLYMAPEQIRGHEVTPRTDLYALGCVLFELVTGDVPFLGETAGATLHMHCYSVPPRPTEKALDCPLQLERIILKLMEKEADKRYQSALELAEDLKTVHETVTYTNHERARNFPLGYPQKEDSPPALNKKTKELPRRIETAWNSPVVLLLGSLLLLSLIGNSLLWRQSGELSRWKSEWTRAAGSSVEAVRIDAIETAGRMARHDSRQLNVLVAAMGDSSDSVRAAAVRTTGEAGAVAINEVPLLLKIQKSDESEEVRQSAMVAIERIRSSGSEPAGGKFWWILLTLSVLGAGGGYWYWKRQQDNPFATS